MKKSPTMLEIRAAQDRAEEALAMVREVRMRYRRRSSPGGVRQEPLKRALAESKPAALELRRFIGMTPHHPVLEPFDAENREVLRQLRQARDQLRKMLR